MKYMFADVEIDTATQELRRGAELVHVEPQVLAVLEYLIRHRDRVVTKIELLDEVWGDRFVSESALTSRIKSVRKVCGDSGREQRVLRTVHGRGYRFVAEVVEADTAAPPQPVPVAMVEGGGGIVGRVAELSALEAAMGNTAHGQRQAVFLTGEAGIGKSALLAEFLERIDDPASWYVLRGQCLQQRGGAEPYFGLFDALGGLARVEGAEVVDVIEQVAPSWLAQLPSLLDEARSQRIERRLLGATAQRMLREGSDIIEELSQSRPVVLALEDLHWADGCTLDVLELLLQRTDPAPVLMLGTARHGGSVESLIAAMTATGRATEVSVTALDGGALGALVTDWLGVEEVPEELLTIVQRRCEGIPLFAQEILAAWVSQGQVSIEGREVHLDAAVTELENTIPASLRSLIERELAELDEAEVAMLEVGAVAGAEFAGATVAVALGRPLTEVESELSSVSRRLHYLDTAGGVSWPDGTISTRFSFNHELYQQALYARTNAAQRAGLHEAVGTALEHGYSAQPAEVVGVLADHFTQAGDGARAVEYLRLAGEQAAERSAGGHAVDFLLEALAQLENLPPGPDRDQAELKVRLSMGPPIVATRGWFGEGVLENYERALALAGGDAEHSEAAIARYGMATITELRGQYGKTEELLTPLVAEDQDELQLEVRELMACSTFHQGAFVESLGSAESALARWNEGDYSVFMSRLAEHPAAACNSWASLASWYLGDSDESLVLADRAIEQGERNLYALSTAQIQRAYLHQFRNEPEACGEWAQRAMDVALDQGFAGSVMQAKIMMGWVEAVTGHPESGALKLADGLQRYQGFGARLKVPYFMGLRADASIEGERHDDALEQIRLALTDMAETTRSFFYEPELHRLRARALAESGGSTLDIRAALDQSLDRARHLGAVPLELRAATMLLRFENEHGDPAPWREEVERLLQTFEDQAETVDAAEARAALDS